MQTMANITDVRPNIRNMGKQSDGTTQSDLEAVSSLLEQLAVDKLVLHRS